MAKCDECEKWKRIAIDLKANDIQESNSGDFVDAQGNHIFQVMDIGKCREQAAKELNLQVTRESGYIDRLEAAYIDAKSQLEAGCGWDGEQIEVEERDLIEAQSALAKIREGG